MGPGNMRKFDVKYAQVNNLKYVFGMSSDKTVNRDNRLFK